MNNELKKKIFTTLAYEYGLKTAIAIDAAIEISTERFDHLDLIRYGTVVSELLVPDYKQSKESK
jgi:hypothetical protein